MNILGLLAFVALAGASSPVTESCSADLSLLRVEVGNYPAIARSKPEQGDVTVLLTLRQDGSVEGAKVLDGPPLLHSITEDMLRWKFRSGARTREVRVRVAFRLVGPPKNEHLTTKIRSDDPCNWEITTNPPAPPEPDVQPILPKKKKN
jgi:TonB family protein